MHNYFGRGHFKNLYGIYGGELIRNLSSLLEYNISHVKSGRLGGVTKEAQGSFVLSGSGSSQVRKLGQLMFPHPSLLLVLRSLMTGTLVS